MRKYTVSEPVQIILDGEKYLLESGDQIRIINEGLMDKFAAFLARHKDALRSALEKELTRKFGTTDAPKLMEILASKYGEKALRRAAALLEKVINNSKTEAAVAEDILRENVEAAAAELVSALFKIVAGGGLLSILAYLYLVHDWSPVRAVERIINKFLR